MKNINFKMNHSCFPSLVKWRVLHNKKIGSKNVYLTMHQIYIIMKHEND